MSKILSIETSCDETSVAVVNWSGSHSYTVLSHITNSQIVLHQQYGGVFPALAKREHQRNIIPILFKSLEESSLLQSRTKPQTLDTKTRKKLEQVLEREPEILDKVILLAEQYKTPKISAVAVTYGPGLEIALWTGFNTARALAVIWDCDLVPTNHMEGHIFAALVGPKNVPQLKNKNCKLKITNVSYPSLGLLISCGHTELVLMRDEHKYTIIGQTLDDAVGEAYDKSARLLGIPYPGGIRVSQIAESVRNHKRDKKIYMVRHGESVANAEKKYAGALDSPLTKRGVTQAKDAAQVLKTKDVSLIISSKLSRAVETATHIRQFHTRAQEYQNSVFNEIHMGALQGQAKRAGEIDIFEIIAQKETKESAAQIVNRCRKAWQVLYTQSMKTNDEVVLSAHGVMLVCMMAVLRGATADNLVSQCRKVGQMSNADMMHITVGHIEDFLYPKPIDLPRPMIHNGDFNFSFSGLKTAVRNQVRSQKRVSKKFRDALCLEFENAVSEVLVYKTNKAIKKYGVKNLVIGGGVSANTNIRREMTKLCEKHGIGLYVPELSLAGDNALMINLAGYRRWKQDNYPKRVTRVKGNLKID